MKNRIIAILVGAIIVFAYQALSWMVLPTHQNSFKYTESEDAVLAALKTGIPEEGMYMIPGRPPGMSEKEYQEKCQARADQPWAAVEYHNNMDMNMGKTMGLGFLAVFLSVAIVVWLLEKARPNLPGYMDIVIATLMFGVFIAVYDHISEWLFMSRSTHYITGELVDAIVAWLLCGLWLGYWLRREPGKIERPVTSTTTV